MPARNRAPQRQAERREQILTAAAKLFDDQGIGPVSVGKIAQAAGVSPGNLYYWFADKTEIVHALFDRWAAESAPPDGLADPVQVLAAIWGREAGQQRTNQGYRFFTRELFWLLDTDPVLAERYRTNYRGRQAQSVERVRQVIAAGLAREPEPPVTLMDLARSVWLLSEMAPSFQHSVDPEHDPVAGVRAIMAPLLTDAGREALGLSS